MGLADVAARSPEKRDLRIAFIPIVCAAPLLYAHRHGLFAANGLHVELIAAPGWSGVKELLVHHLVDAAHMLSPMPFACSLGLDGRRTPVKLLAIQNLNGQALTLSVRHRDRTHPSELRGLTFGVPYRFSMQRYLLCHWLAEHGVDPLHDIRIVEVSPPRMPYYVETGRVDGVLAPEPYNQAIVRSGAGVIFALSRDIWPGHPCCSLAVTARFLDAHPDTCRRLVRGLVEAERALRRADPTDRARIARELADPAHLDQRDPSLVEAVLTGEFDDGRGTRRLVPDRIDFVPDPRPEYGVWILAQMQRWGQLAARVDYDRTTAAVMATGLLDDPTAACDSVPTPGLSRTDPFASMRAAPFSAFREEDPRPAPRDLGEPASARLTEVITQLAAVTGGLPAPPLAVTGEDLVGELEQLINELLLNLRFSGEAVLEQRDQLERRVQERTVELEQELELRRRAEAEVRTMNASLGALVAERTAEIELQNDAIVRLSTPIIEVSERVLVLPIIGTLDARRADDMTTRLLAEVVRTRARAVVLDLTGVDALDAAMADLLLRAVRSVRLLGADAMLSGISPLVAATLTGLAVDLSGVASSRDLRQAIELCTRAAR
jgi:nitrate/nitrite transport system substrate-binding protein